MVCKVKEHIIFACGFKNPLGSFSADCGFVSCQHILEDSWGDIFASVVNFDSFIDINSLIFSWRFIENFSFEGVFDVFSNIIVGQSDDVLGIKIVFDENLISMEDIRLMSIVGVGVGAGNKDSPISSIRDS